MENPLHLLLVDAPSLPLEEDLPLLESLGYRCAYLPSVQEVGSYETVPDLLLVSQEIPGGAHGETFAHVRSRFPDVPIVVVAHLRSLSLAIEFFRQGVIDYLLAPLDPDDTRQRLEAAYEKARNITPVLEEPVEVPAMLAPSILDAPATTRLSCGWLDLEAIPCGILVYDEEGRLLRANEKALSLFGQLSVEALRLVLEEGFEYYHPLDLQERPFLPEAWPVTRARKDRAFRTAVVSIERPGANRIWLRIDAAPFLEEGQIRFIVASMNNITEERKEIERLRSLVPLSPPAP